MHNSAVVLNPAEEALCEERAAALSWVRVTEGAPYFETDRGEAWMPIGQNDAVTWPDLAGLFRRRDPASVERYLCMLATHGVTCLRVMLEYCQG